MNSNTTLDVNKKGIGNCFHFAQQLFYVILATAFGGLARPQFTSKGDDILHEYKDLTDVIQIFLRADIYQK